ncbi:MAG: FAD-dependent oxidoreductase [Rhodothermales bacterium]|nr:FAD-dependent oxidoreductase [Rhodothermales bacterium]
MSAWYLSGLGFRVTIVDRQAFGAGCSHGNCGYICPSSVLPLAQPGAVPKTLAAMLRRDSPFAIRPTLRRGFISWFWNFARSCNRSDMLRSAGTRHLLLQSSMALYKDLVSSENIDCEWQERGLLYVYDNKRTFEAYAETDRLLSDRFGVSATPYDGDQLVEFEPSIKPGAGGGWHYELDCHIRPDKLMSALRTRMEDNGVEFVESVSVDGFVREGKKARALTSNGRSIEADQFLVATGATTPFLNEHLGLRIPIEPGKGYSLTMPSPKSAPKHPIIFDDSHVAITPMQSGYRIGSTMEFVGYDSSINRKRLALLKSAAAKYLHDPYCEPIEEEWFGWRPMTWDGKPLIGVSPIMENVWIAAGHSMLGLSMATGTGKLVSEMIAGEEPHLDPAPFSPERFS